MTASPSAESPSAESPSAESPSAESASAESASESEAQAIAQEAYLYGYPRVELARRIHQETRRVADHQAICAPPNHFFYFSRLARPGDGRVIKAPNNDTLYASGYLDLRAEPVVLRVPLLGSRDYFGLVVDAAGRVPHRLSRTLRGPGGHDFLFVGPRCSVPIPPDVTPLPIAGDDVWLLMRVATSGHPEDEQSAAECLRQFRLEPLSRRARLSQPQPDFTAEQIPRSTPHAPMGELTFFHDLARMLERNPVPPEDTGLVARWGRIGLSPAGFTPETLPGPVRQGVLRALATAEQIVQAAQFGIANTVQGWNYSLVIGKTGTDWALNAAIARGGYGNLPEDSVYYQRTLSASGEPLTGQCTYTLTFPPGQLPPVGAFWSLTAYNRATFDLFENVDQRYSLGDRTRGLIPNRDGSLTVTIQSQPPADPQRRANWLPVGPTGFYLILRTYDPAPAILEGRWAPPEVVPGPTAPS